MADYVAGHRSIVMQDLATPVDSCLDSAFVHTPVQSTRKRRRLLQDLLRRARARAAALPQQTAKPPGDTARAKKFAPVSNMSSTCERVFESEFVEDATSVHSSCDESPEHNPGVSPDCRDAVHTPMTARFPQSEHRTSSAASEYPDSPVLPVMYHLYSHGEANGIDLTDLGGC